MTLRARSSSWLFLAAIAAGCDGGRRSEPIVDPAGPGARLLVTTDTTVLAASSTPAPAVDLARLGVTAVEATYRVTTPVDEPFAFDLVSWRDGAAGAAELRVAHGKDGADTPSDPASLANAGIVADGGGLAAADGWLSASGDGLVRVTLRGRIERDQVLVVVVDGAATIVEVDLGPRSEINRPDSADPDETDVLSRTTIYSSDSPLFGLPTVAVSGDRTSVVCYEGDRAAHLPQRYEMRLQHDAATGAVTGGGSVETSADTGYWRDHEIAALHNVLAIARCEVGGIHVRFSFDRGASIAQEIVLPASASQARLVQVGMAADYTLAVAFWSLAADNSALQLHLAEAVPIAFDATGSPTWFQFGPVQVVHAMPPDSTPLTTGIAWSDGGDLVIGYGATWFDTGAGFGWTSTTQFRCAVRRYGEPMQDRLVDTQEIFGMDPTVAVLGTGASMRIFYAYEVATGVRLAVSTDGGDTFGSRTTWGSNGDHLPTVFARDVAGAVRVDVLFLAARAEGSELHRARWLDWPTSPRLDEGLTKARLEEIAAAPGPYVPFAATMRQTQVAWLGYDAVQDGAEIVVAYDEATTDNTWWCGVPSLPGAIVTTGGFALPPTFTPATPPPLAPGMTEPVPPVDAAHRHQLKLLRLR